MMSCVLIQSYASFLHRIAVDVEQHNCYCSLHVIESGVHVHVLLSGCQLKKNVYLGGSS